jgi:hypothetical protein
LGAGAVSDSPAAAIAENVGVPLALAVGVELGDSDVQGDVHVVLLGDIYVLPQRVG